MSYFISDGGGGGRCVPPAPSTKTHPWLPTYEIKMAPVGIEPQETSGKWPVKCNPKQRQFI